MPAESLPPTAVPQSIPEWWERMAAVYRRVARAYRGRPDEGYCAIKAEACERTANRLRKTERTCG